MVGREEYKFWMLSFASAHVVATGRRDNWVRKDNFVSIVFVNIVQTHNQYHKEYRDLQNE